MTSLRQEMEAEMPCVRISPSLTDSSVGETSGPDQQDTTSKHYYNIVLLLLYEHEHVQHTPTVVQASHTEQKLQLPNASFYNSNTTQ